MAHGLIYPTLVVGVFTFIVYKIIAFYMKFRARRNFFDDAPGPRDKHWLYGSLHLAGKTEDDRFAFFDRNVKNFPRYFRMWIGPFQASVVLVHPETIKVVMKTTGVKPRSIGSPYKFFLTWLGEGLLLSGGKRWARSRRLLTPAFHFDILKPYVEVYNEAASKFIKSVSKYADTGTSFELFERVSMCTLDIILKCAFSFESNCQAEGETDPYVKAVHHLTAAGTERAWNPPLYLDFVFYLTPMGRKFAKNCKYVHDIAEDVIEKRKKVLENKNISPKKYLDFLDVLLTAKDENNEGLTKLEIRNEVDTFLFEGHDTTASGISWTLYALATHPEHQEKVQNEIDEIMLHKEKEMIEWDDLQKLEYLSLCIKESLRLYSAVPVIMRENTEEVTIDGKTFPPGTDFVLHLYNLHHNEVVWDNPFQYRPERFTKENISKMDSFAFCPFSAGPRNCIGQNFATNEMKVVIARILYRYRIEVDTTVEVKKRFSPVLRTLNGMNVFLKRRQ